MASKKIRIRNPIGSLYRKIARIKRNAKKNEAKKTWPELEMEKILKELRIDFTAQKIIGSKIFDIFIPSWNMVIEVHGNYWHGNPLIYEEFSAMQIRNKKNDKFKKVLAKGNGYKYEEVWELDLKNNRKDIVERFKGLRASFQ